MNQMSTKEKIIAKSLELFNSGGVENVTTRHIAKALGISQGNLHYHYPNKEKLLETLFHDMLAAFKSAERFIDDMPLAPEEMLMSMIDNFQIMHAYRLFFQQNDVIWRKVPMIKESMRLLFQTKQAEISALITLYHKEGKLREEITTQQVEFLAEQFIFNIQSWLIVKDYDERDLSFDYYAKHLFRLWLPYLNPKEATTWAKLLD